MLTSFQILTENPPLLEYAQKKCRYADGYVYQQIYSCQTCYEEQAKINGVDLKDASSDNLKLSKTVQPHGFCLACMMHCHDGHEVHELYSKLDFRCDCGNSKMPYSCHIDSDLPVNVESAIAITESKDDQNQDQ